jgi:hypothetical protein
MLYPARKLVEQELTLVAVNAKIDLLETAYTLSGATAVPAVASITDGRVTDPAGITSYPALVHIVGATGDAEAPAAAFGVRDARAVPVVLLYLTRQADLAAGVRDTEVTLEALVPIIEGLAGKSWGATLHQIIKVDSLAQQVEAFRSESAATVRLGGKLRFTMWLRTAGV